MEAPAALTVVDSWHHARSGYILLAVEANGINNPNIQPKLKDSTCLRKQLLQWSDVVT